MEVIPDPSTVHFHLPGYLSVLVHREYNDFIKELVSKFPHEKEGILKFYGTCWKVLSLFSLPVSHTHVLLLCYANLTTYSYVSYKQIFNALNSLELKSLEEPLYLFGQFFKKPLECLTLGMKNASLYSSIRSFTRIEKYSRTVVNLS